MAMFSKGIVLAQHKEPALSRGLVRFVNPQTDQLHFERPAPPGTDLTQEELIEIARAAQIVDERDGKLLYRKLLRSKNRAVAVVGDAVDDEPYVSSKINPMLKLREPATGALEFCRQVANCDKVFVMAYKNITQINSRIPRSLEGYPVLRLRGGYPAEPHASKLKLGLGRKLIVGAGALIHFYRAIMENRRQTTTFITVTGDCVANPMNLEVSLGMTVMQVLERCGLSAQPTHIVCGGPMTGVAIFDPERTMVTHTTRAILAFQDDHKDRRYSCIGCGRCEQVCPMGLNPMYIYRFVDHNYFTSLRQFDSHLCIQCGTCSYMCPSKLNVAGNAAKARRYALEHFISLDEEADEYEA